jgi:ATP-binding cassette subfamily C protein
LAKANTKTIPGLLMSQAKRVFLAGLLYAAALSVCLNLLQLTMPLFMLQVHDRVLNSQSMDTLVDAHHLGDRRARGAWCPGIHPCPVIPSHRGRARAPFNHAHSGRRRSGFGRPGPTRATQSLRDISELRSFLTSSAVTAPLDAVWSPIFLGALFVLHPLFGLIGAVSAALLVCGGLVTDMLTRQLTKEANQTNIEAVAKIGASLRHAEAIEAMGMLPALANRWRALQMQALSAFEASGTRSKAMSSITRSLRYSIQIVTLAAGAFLVLQQAITPGAMMASSILVGRLLIPFDSIIDNWRQWVLAIAGWRRLEATLKADLAIRQTMPTPHSSGDIVVDKLVYAAPGLDVPIIKGISFSLSPGEVSGRGRSIRGRQIDACAPAGRNLASHDLVASSSTATTPTSGSAVRSAKWSDICRNLYRCWKAQYEKTLVGWQKATLTKCWKQRDWPTSMT